MHKDFELIDIQAKIIPNNKPKKSTNLNKNIIVEEKNDDINELEDLPKTKTKKSNTIIIDVDNNSKIKKKSAKK